MATTTVDLGSARTARLVDHLRALVRRATLTGDQLITVPLDQLDDLRVWRRSAIRAAHLEGRRASTHVGAEHVTLCLHRPARVDAAEQRRAANVLGALLP